MFGLNGRNTADSTEIAREARRWVARLHSQEVNQDDAAALRRWRQQSSAHEKAFAEAELRWSNLRTAARNVAARRPAQTNETVFRSNGLHRRALITGAFAVSTVGAAGALAIAPPFALWPSLAELAADYRTATGQQRQIALAAKVSVVMNTQTSLSVRSGSHGVPAFEVVAGEVSVAAESPVMAIAGIGRISTDRATFDLLHSGDRVAVTCIAGTVDVACSGRQVAVGSGQRVIYDRSGLGPLSMVNSTNVEAWRRGLLVFEETPLAEVVSEINRYRRGRVILMNADLGRLPVDATFRLDQIDGAAYRLADVFGTRISTLPGGIILLG